MLHCGVCSHTITKKEAVASFGRDTLSRYFPAVILRDAVPITFLPAIANQEQLACSKCGAKGKWMDQPSTNPPE